MFDGMPDVYDALVNTGFVGSLKRDVLLEASRDLEYLGSIRSEFVKAGEDARVAATACTVRLVEDLLKRGLCVLATWSRERDGSHEVLRTDPERLTALVDADEPFAYFLVTTQAGDAWVDRYLALVQEI